MEFSSAITNIVDSWQKNYITMLTLKEGLPHCSPPKQISQSKPQINKEKQHKLIKSFQKRFQNRREQVNEITTASEDDSSDDQLNELFSEF